jgi:diaminopimelate epimerase
MRLYFTKMQGAGNDFVMLDLISQRFQLRPQHIRRLADRHFGIGCDQVLVVEPPTAPEADFAYRIFNADGSEVAQCGNGARCFARFVRDRRLTRKRTLTAQTHAGLLTLKVLGDSQVEVTQGTPRFDPQAVPLTVACAAPSYSTQLGGQLLEFGALSLGNPHAVLRVDNAAQAAVEDIGKALQASPLFPASVNVGFLQIQDRHHATLRVYERGVGETLACGSGACAAAVYGILRGWLESPVRIALPGGNLQIDWAGEGQPVVLTGPTEVVFEGSINL